MNKYFIYKDSFNETNGMAVTTESTIFWLEDNHTQIVNLCAKTAKGWASRKSIEIEPWIVTGEREFRGRKNTLWIDTNQAERLIRDYNERDCKIYTRPMDTTAAMSLAMAKIATDADRERGGMTALE